MRVLPSSFPTVQHLGLFCSNGAKSGPMRWFGWLLLIGAGVESAESLFLMFSPISLEGGKTCLIKLMDSLSTRKDMGNC